MVTTPNLQSLPRRFISFRRVATHRAPERQITSLDEFAQKDVVIGTNSNGRAIKVDVPLPVAPTGCPRAIAPPFTFTLERSSPNLLQQ